MVYQLIILVVIPIILGILITSPFEPEVKKEPIEEIPQEEPNTNYLYIILGLLWIFILIRVLSQIKKGTYRFGNKR